MEGTVTVIKVRERVPEEVITREDWSHSWGRERETGGNWCKKEEKGTSKQGTDSKRMGFGVTVRKDTMLMELERKGSSSA